MSMTVGELLGGAIITLSGSVSVQLKPLASTYSDSTDPSYNEFIPLNPIWYNTVKPYYSPTTIPNTGLYPYFTPPPFTNANNIPLTIKDQYKNIFYNRSSFLLFVEKLKNKTLIFIDNGQEKIVDKIEALKFVFFHYIAGKDYKNWDDFEYKDEEWHLFFREAKTASEVLEAFDFTAIEAIDILCL